MEDKMDTRLSLTIEDGSKVIINVLDIIDSYTYDKTFMIYTLDGENKTVFASILNEKDTTYSLDTITNEEELNFINSEISRYTLTQEAA